MAPASWSLHKAVFQLNSQIPLHSNSSTRATTWSRGRAGEPPAAEESTERVGAGAPRRGPLAGRPRRRPGAPAGRAAPTAAGPAAGPQDLASGANVSSEGTHPVCRLPLAALRPWTSGVWPRRPAAVIQYGAKGPGTRRGPAGCSLEPVTTATGGRGERREAREGGERGPCRAPPPASRRPRSLLAFALPQTERDHQCGDYTALPGGGRTPPPVVPIHSPREPASGGNENSPGGALPRGPACTHSGMLPSRSAPIPAQQNVALACLFAIPAVGWPPDGPRPVRLCVVWPPLLGPPFSLPPGPPLFPPPRGGGPGERRAGEERRGRVTGGPAPGPRGPRGSHPGVQLWLFGAFTTWLTVG